MAAPAFRAAGTLLNVTTTGASQSGSCALPAGVADGDFLLMVVRSNYAGSTVTTPSGWTSISAHEKTSDSQTDLRLFRRTASSEPASYTVTNDGQGAGNNQFIAQIFAWVGGTWDTSATWEGTGASTTISCPSVTAANASSTLICVYGQFGNNAYANPYTAPSGMTERQDAADSAGAGGKTSFSLADVAVGAGATGTKNATATDGSTWHLAVSLVIYDSSAPTYNKQRVLLLGVG